MDCQHIGAATLKAPPGRGRLPLQLVEIANSLDHMPAKLGQFQLLAQLRPAIEQSQAFRTHHPLMTVRSDKIGLHCLNIELYGADTLNRIDTKEDVVATAELADTLQIHLKTRGVLHRTYRNESGSFIDQGKQCIFGRVMALQIGLT